MPHLSSLFLDHSPIESIRDLGTRLSSLVSLSMNGCGLTELDGIVAFPQLEVLTVQNNEIASLSPLMMNDRLKVFVSLSS